MVVSSENLDTLPLPPGNFGLPFIGETINFLQDPDFAAKQQARYGPIFKTAILGRPTIFVCNAEAHQFLLTQENKYFAVAWPSSTAKLLGQESLAQQMGTVHQQRRRLLAQAFQPRALAGYVPTIERITTNYLQRWESLQTFAWYPELRQYTFDVAGSLLVGTENAAQTPLCILFETWCNGLFTIPFPFFWTKFGKAIRARRQLMAYIEEIVKQRQQSDVEGQDALGILLQAKDEEGQSLSLAELKEQVLLLLFAGHETLTSAIASFCLLMAQHPQMLEKARLEQQQFVGRDLTLETLKQMTYLEQILKEVLRLVPPVGGGFRKVLQTCNLNGYRIPEGWTILYQINQTHHAPDVYPQPDTFDPDRFAEGNDRIKPFAYVPFGGGLRECLGKEFARLEMKIFAASLLRSFHWELLPNQSLEMLTVPTPHPRDGLKIRFSRLGN